MWWTIGSFFKPKKPKWTESRQESRVEILLVAEEIDFLMTY
jgi:hypothetical protein